MSIKTELQGALAYCNEKLIAKGGEAASTVYGIGDKIAALPAGSGITPDNITYCQTNEKAKKYIDEVTYDSSDYSYSYMEDETYAPGTENIANTRPLSVGITVPAGTLTIIERYNKRVRRETVSAGLHPVINLIPSAVSDYYVTDSSGSITAYGQITPSGALRMISCKTNQCINVRDLGGWACDGGSVKYGLLFRGAQPLAADKDVLVEQCGIQIDLNLRGAAESPETTSPLGIELIRPADYVWYTLQDNTTWRKILSAVFDAVKYQRPLYFHCSAGADRTGTVACIIEALLGMSQSDIDKDYELTCFATGTRSDEQARRRNEIQGSTGGKQWRDLINEINAFPNGNTFRDKVVNWVGSLGFTAAEINAFRHGMIDGTPQDITVDGNIPIPVQSISVTTERSGAAASRGFPGDSFTAQAHLLPSNTTQTGVIWSIESGDATITQAGAITLGSSMSDTQDLTVVVRATSADNPAVWGEATITIPQNLYIPDSTVGCNKYYSPSNHGYVTNAGWYCLCPIAFSSNAPVNLRLKGFYKRNTSNPNIQTIIYFDESNNVIGRYTTPQPSSPDGVTDYVLAIGTVTEDGFEAGKSVSDINSFIINVKESGTTISTYDTSGKFIAWE